MRIAFLIVILAGSAFYAYVAFADLAFQTRTGRLGPGFFPRIIGLSLCAFTLWTLADALLRRARVEGEATGWVGWSDVAVLIALSVGYAVLLRLFGGLVASVIFLALALSLLNRGRYLQNAVLALALPGAIYFLFDKILNASVPPAIFELPL